MITVPVYFKQYLYDICDYIDQQNALSAFKYQCLCVVIVLEFFAACKKTVVVIFNWKHNIRI